jgi:DamX protein
MPTENSYLEAHGLEHDPFSADVGGDYYTNEELTHRIDLLIHLLEFSQQVILVTSAPGSGKSSTKTFLLNNPETSWSLKEIRLQEDQDQFPFDRELSLYLRDDLRIDAIDLFSGIEKYIEHCFKTQRLPVLFIDDAHNLSIDALELLFQIARVHHQTTYFRIVLFCDERINNKLDEPKVKVLSSGSIHTINLPAFTRDQTGDYLRCKILDSSDAVTFPFTAKDINHIYKASGGNPAKVNRLARQLLLDPTAKKTEKNLVKKQGSFSILSYLKFAGLTGIALVMLAGSYLFIDSLYQEKTPAKVSLALPASETTMLKKQTPVETEVPMAVVEDVTVQEEIMEANEAVAEASEREALAEAFTEPSIITEARPAVDSVQGDVMTLGGDITEGDVTIPAQEEIRTAGASGPRTQSWYFEQPATSYVLQVLGAREQVTIEAYLNNMTDHHDDMATYTTRNYDLPWYVLTYGIYPDRDTALSAIAQLPVQIRNQNPWAKPIAGIQIDIERLSTP